MKRYFKILMKPQDWNLLKAKSEELHNKVSYVHISSFFKLRRLIKAILKEVDVEVTYGKFYKRK